MRVDYTILVPVYNEEAGLAHVLERLVAFVRGDSGRSDILIVDDGSDDRTPLIAKAAAERDPDVVRTIRHDPNAGLIAGLRTGARATEAPIVVVLDADLSYAPETVPRLVEALVREEAAIVLASPYMPGGRVSHVPLDRLLYSRGANLILSACTLGRLKTFTGMVRAYRTPVLLEYLERAPAGEFNSWLVAEALRDGRRIVEVPAHLAWPPERFTAAPRVSTSKLFTRALDVIRTACILTSVTFRSSFSRAR